MTMRKILIATLCLLSCAGIHGRDFSVKAGRLEFTIGSDARGAAYVIDGKKADAVTDAEFWRLILDDGHS